MLAVELTSKYEDGFLPRSGGWMEQDFFYVFLIGEGLSAKRTREQTEHRKAQSKIPRR